MRYRMKPGMGKHHMRTKGGQRLVVRPGDVIDCEPWEVAGVLHKFEQLDPDPPPISVSSTLDVVAAGDGTYNVINPGNGAPVNDAPLSAQEASDLAGIPIAEFSEPTIALSPPADDEAAEAGNAQTTLQTEEDADVRKE